MPALPSWLTEPLWDRFAALLPERPVYSEAHPLGCHRPRINDRVIFDKLIQVLVFGCGYRRVADATCSATTIRDRRDKWVELGVFEHLEPIVLEAYDRMVGPTLARLDRLGPLPEQATVHLDNAHGSDKGRKTAAEHGLLAEVAVKGVAAPIQNTKRWPVERTNAWGNQLFKIARCTERKTRVIDAYLSLAHAIITLRRLIRQAWTSYRWDARPKRRS